MTTQLYYKAENDRIISFSTDGTVVAVTAITLMKYYDGTGKERCLYNWKLDKNDRIPDGKRNGPSLREMEKGLQTSMFQHIALKGGNLTVLELVKRYTSTKIGVRNSTRTGYQTVINFLEKDSFGKRHIDTIRISEAKLWLIELQQRK